MSDEKLLAVTFLVKPQNVYDVLQSLTQHKVGNVEVRPLAPVVNGNAEPEPVRHPNRKTYEPGQIVKTKGGQLRRMGVRAALRKVMKMNEPFNYWELAAKMNFNPKSVASAMNFFLKDGTVRKVKAGVYMRIREDA